MRLRGRHYRTGDPVEVHLEHGQITAIEKAKLGPVDHEAGWIAPALFDLQINGGYGVGFSSAELTISQVRHVVEMCRMHGIGAFCPTLVTNSFEALSHGFATLAAACEQDSLIRESMPMFHLEGPYISPESGPRGAHPAEHVRLPNLEEFRRLQDAARGRIGLVTLAPEREGALPFIERLAREKIVIAIGHTAATGAQIRDAIHAGAKLSTHLGNGSHATLPRHDNYIWEQLAADELWASLIPDGHHLPAAVVKSIIRGKTPARSIITCDASSLAGLPPGRYVQWDTQLEVLPGGKVVVPGTPYLAGSGVYTDSCIGKAVEFTKLSLGEVIDMASLHPRELLGLPLNRLEVGQTCRVVMFDFTNGVMIPRMVF